MLNNLIFYVGYAFLSSFGLYKIKLSGLALNSDLFIGGSFYVVGFLIWLFILKMNPLSIAFPLAASSLIIATQIFGYYFLGEGFNTGKIIGIAVIIVGIIITFRNS